MRFLISMNFLNKCVDLLSKVFSSQRVIAAVTLGGLFLFYFICLLPSCLCGDFVKNRRAVRLIARGWVESGLKSLKKMAPAYDNSREPSPPASAFDYDKIINHPYSYSFIKKLPMVVIGGILFFAALAVAAASVLANGLDGFAALMLVLVPAAGLLLFIISLVISGKMLRSATKRYHLMIDYIKDITVRPAAEVIEEKPIEEAAVEICLRIENIALSGGADYAVLSGLYAQISGLMARASSSDVINRLAAALDVVDLLVDSAMQK